MSKNWFDKLFDAMSVVGQGKNPKKMSGNYPGSVNYQSGFGNQVGNNNIQSIGVGGNRVGVNHGQVVQILSGEPQVFEIDGKSFPGSKVEQRNGRVLVDGKDVTDELETTASDRPLIVAIQGSVGQLTVSSCHQLAVAGDVESLEVGAGTIKIDGNVAGSVHCGAGDISCGDIGGKAKVNVGTIHRK